MKKACFNKNNYSEALVPIQDALDVISGKWRIQIVIAIKNGCERFNQIQSFVDGISPKMLSKELKELEQHKLIVRTVEDGYPVKILYSLDEYATSLTPIIFALREWGKQHRKKLFSNE